MKRAMETIDLRETVIPFSLLKIAYHFKRMKIGDAMEIIGTDREVIRDLKSVLRAGNYKLHIVDIAGPPDPYFKLHIKKTTMKNIKPKEKCHVGNRSERH